MNEELVRDIYERMGRMEAKLDDVRAIRAVSDEALTVARRAEQSSNTNSKAIEGLSATIKWGFGLVASIVVPLVIFVLNFITK